MAPCETPWNEHLTEELKRLWADGLAAREIAEALGGGISRCAVLGKINRLGLSRRRPAQPRKPPGEVIPRGRPIRRRPVFIAPSVPPPLPSPVLPKLRMRRLQLLQLADHHCRWPIGDPHRHPFYFCAADRRHGDAYCAFHMARAFARPRR
jgi:GcrA cell cycle regulator